MPRLGRRDTRPARQSERRGDRSTWRKEGAADGLDKVGAAARDQEFLELGRQERLELADHAADLFAVILVARSSRHLVTLRRHPSADVWRAA